MSKYEGEFNGGPLHGEVIPLPKAEQIYTLTKVYNSGLTTESTYKLDKQQDGILFYNLIEEKFSKFSKHLDRKL